MATVKGTRQVVDVVDGGGLYFSRVVTAGPYAFCGSVAADETGGIAADARVPPQYEISPPAEVVNQTHYIFSKYKAALEQLGSGPNEFLQVEQHIPRKVYADGYLDVSRGKGFMDKGRPSSALLQTGELRPVGAVINPTGIALIPDESADLVKEIAHESEGYHESLKRGEYGETYAEEGPFNEVVAGGPYVFTVGDLPNDWALGEIHPDARVNPFIWWGSEIRNETDFLLGRLRGWLGRVDSGLENLVHISIYLIDMSDLFELDRAWKKWFPEGNVARTVIPCRGLGQPRHEGENLGHAQNAPKSEFIAQSIRPGRGVEKEIISTGADVLFPDAEAVKADPLLWTSALYAAKADGRLCTELDTASQLEYLFKRLDDICQAGGTDISQLVRLRAFLTDPDDAYLVYGALRRAVPNDPPTVMVTSVPGPMPVKGATVMIDGVAAV